ncbi:MAG: hypothetical protein LBQ16_04425 [Gracilibacteraceae bacterium]|nr:hypothetical protein [Gracilibacteraceae bacterium]
MADAWLNVYSLASTLGKAEAYEALENSLGLYAGLMEAGGGSDIQLKYATAAFYNRDFTLAGELLTDLTAREPENADALTTYGAYLFYGLTEYAQAEDVWRKALDLTEDEAERALLEYYIGIARTAKDAAETAAAAEEND